MVHPGFKLGAATLLKRFGEQGRALYQASLDAFALVEQTIETNQIACDYVRSGHLDLAFKPGHVPALENEAHALRTEFGVTTPMVPRIDRASEVGTSEH